MSEWPEGWYRGAGGSSGTPGKAGPTDPTVQSPYPGSNASPGGHAGSSDYGSGGASGYGPGGRLGSGSAWPQQPPSRGRPGGPGGPGGPVRPGGRRWLRPRRIIAMIALLLVVVIIGSVGMYFYVGSKLHQSDVLVDYNGRPAVSAGTNWLIAGSDSRQGLTRRQERKLATGPLSDAEGERSDTILILHIPSGGGKPVLVSIPRDSYVPIPGHGESKINAAFDLGGPKLLAETIQQVTGLYINHYMGIGFGGFVSVVNAVGGVRMCLPGPMVDPAIPVGLLRSASCLRGTLWRGSRWCSSR